MTDTRDAFPTDADQFEVPATVAATEFTEFVEEAIHEAPETAPRSPRTIRILLAALLVAAAGFIWFNFLAVPDNEQTLVNPVPLPGSRMAVTEPAAGMIAETMDADAVGNGAAAADTDAVAPLPLIAAQPAAADGAAPSVARQLIISELPFLVTAAPLRLQPEEPAAIAEVTRPTVQRVSVNPFTPVVLTEVFATPDLPDFPAAESSALAGPAQPDVLDVPIPAAPPQATVPRTVTVEGAVQMPAPTPAASTIATIPAPVRAAATPVAPPVAPPVVAAAPVQPPAAQAAVSSPLAAVRNLPRALPGGSLSPAPRLLQERRAIEDVPTPNLAQLATVQEPVAVQPDPLAAPVPRSNSSPPSPEPEPLGTTALAGSGSPLAAGITPLNRYLRDNNVAFTGSVLGPVSVGVFRTSLTNAAIVISLGQALPDTSIVLTDLRGQQAELTLGEASQTLTMELRR